MNKEKFDITGMTCSACSTRVEQCVRKLPGVSEVSVNLLKNSMVVSYDEHSLDTAGIVAAVENRYAAQRQHACVEHHISIDSPLQCFLIILII